MATPWVAAGVAWHSFAAARNRSAPAGVGRERNGGLRTLKSLKRTFAWRPGRPINDRRLCAD
jgi:hypothetical protein